MQERNYQTEAQKAVETSYIQGVNRQLISMATGTGKTVVFSKLPNRLKNVLPGQTMVLAHREELVDQAIDKMRHINPELKIDKEKAEHWADPNADVIVASVATLGRKNSSRLNRFNWERIDKIITDEAHHSVAQSYQNIYDAANVFNTSKLLLGVTATPSRGDGQALAKIYKKIVYSYTIRQAIEDGWLVDVKGIRVETKTSLDTVKTVAGDFSQNELSDAVNNSERNQLVAKAWLDHGNDRQTIGFTVDIKHAQDLAEMFRNYGVKAEAVWGDDPERTEKLRRHREGDIRVLLNCGVLTEGYDDWHIGCILLARPTKSSTLFTQMVGRGTRLQDGTGNLLIAKESWTDLDGPLKTDTIVIDVVDSSVKHSLITLPTLLGMASDMNLQGNSLVGSIKSIEDAQQQYPNIDFSTLKDINNLHSFIESINLFDIKYPEAVIDNSKLAWHTSADGGFILMLPDKQEVRIRQNILDKFEISAIIDGKRYRGERDSVEEAFQVADNLITDKAWSYLKILGREEKWHSQPVTDSQLKLLMKFYKGRPLPNDLDKGKASRLISSFLAGKAK